MNTLSSMITRPFEGAVKIPTPAITTRTVLQGTSGLAGRHWRSSCFANSNVQTLPNSQEGRFEMFEARAVGRIEQSVQVSFGHSETPGQFCFADAGSEESPVQFRFHGRQRRKRHGTILLPCALRWFRQWFSTVDEVRNDANQKVRCHFERFRFSLTWIWVRFDC